MVAWINLPASADFVHLAYRVRIGGGEWQDVEDTVLIVRIPCRFGGSRPYFIGFQAVQAQLLKRAPGDARPNEELDHAVREIISRAVAPEGMFDIFAAAGLPKPDISVLSDEFLAEVRGMPHRNLAVELLQKLLKSELTTLRRTNFVPARAFSEILDHTIRRYQFASNRSQGGIAQYFDRVALDAERLPRKYGYPPNKQEKATQTVLGRAVLLSAGWAGA
jgi:hypothetical protein